MKHVSLIILFAASGCASWTQTQIDLVTQARKGVANLAQASEHRRDASEQLMKLRRERLDAAFDEDARNQIDLSADWVIDARKAYAVGLDSFAKQQAANESALGAEKSNLAAVDAALQKLQWLQSIQQKFSILPEVQHGNH